MTARAQIAQLIEQSKQLAAVRPPVHVDGYYFPVEVDPTWQGAPALGPLLEQLPGPLWISAYDTLISVGKHSLFGSIAGFRIMLAYSCRTVAAGMHADLQQRVTTPMRSRRYAATSACGSLQRLFGPLTVVRSGRRLPLSWRRSCSRIAIIACICSTVRNTFHPNSCGIR
jgi:hypothetical protein